MLTRRSVTWPGSRRARLLAVVVLGLLCPGLAAAQEKVPAAHEKLERGSLTDDHGIFLPVPASHPGRRYPATDEYPTGPAVGERLPEFSLPNQAGRIIDFHQDRGNSKAIVVFHRSVVW